MCVYVQQKAHPEDAERYQWPSARNSLAVRWLILVLSFRGSRITVDERESTAARAAGEGQEMVHYTSERVGIFVRSLGIETFISI